MNVRTLITRAKKDIRWNIDWKIYENETKIPEIIRSKSIISYELIRNTMYVNTKDYLVENY